MDYIYIQYTILCISLGSDSENDSSGGGRSELIKHILYMFILFIININQNKIDSNR